MNEHHFTFQNEHGDSVFVYQWLPEGESKAVVQIAHGMAEHAGRYRDFAMFLNRHGYAVYANDHRGHGKTAASVELLGKVQDNNFMGMVQDVGRLLEIIKQQHAHKPVYLLGHSMGSFVVQRFLSLYSEEPLAGVVLSGSAGKTHPLLLTVAAGISRFEAFRTSMDAKGHVANKLTFGSYNNQFKSERSQFAWLSRDEQQVQLYDKDPYCGFVCSNGFYIDFFESLKTVLAADNLKSCKRELPYYIVSGDKDPVGKDGKAVRQLIQLYNTMGMTNVDYYIYPNARHEVLNETNKQEVYENMLEWLEGRKDM